MGQLSAGASMTVAASQRKDPLGMVQAFDTGSALMKLVRPFTGARAVAPVVMKVDLKPLHAALRALGGAV